MTQYNKLVRDKIPDILDNKNIPYEKRIASSEEYRLELIKKIGEEVQEFIESDGSPEELADIIEVVRALEKLSEYAGVEEIRQRKLQEKGGFDGRIILKGEK